MVIGFIAANAGLMEKLGRRLMHIGLAVMTAGVVVFAITLNAAGIGITPWQLAPALAVCGLGMGLLMATVLQHRARRRRTARNGFGLRRAHGDPAIGRCPGDRRAGHAFLQTTCTSARSARCSPSFADAMQLVLRLEIGLLVLNLPSYIPLADEAASRREGAH
jgi:hypothetical protein